MIGWLSGRVQYQHSNGAVVVDVHGVGYEVHVASNEPVLDGALVEYFVSTIVRAESLTLYGFSQRSEREFFELLLATPGVGPSTALAALRTMSVEELANAIEADDAKRVALVPGIGAKTASRIVLELKGKVTGSAGSTAAATPPRRDADIEDALRGLGYSTMEIREALRDVQLPEDESSALRVALGILGRS